MGERNNGKLCLAYADLVIVVIVPTISMQNLHIINFHVKGITKFWEILQIGWIVILYNFDIFGRPCGCIISSRKFSP